VALCAPVLLNVDYKENSYTTLDNCIGKTMSITTETEMYQHVSQKQHSNLATTKTEKGEKTTNETNQ